MRLGILGGSFDPVHFGHLLLAEACREACRLQHVWFVPAATPPHKQGRELASDEQRVEMVQLAISGNSSFAVSTIEVERGGVSYTVDTLKAIQEEHPEAELFFLMGADSINDLPNWREPSRICELAIPVVVSRAGTSAPNFDALKSLVDEQRLATIREHHVEMPQIEISSSEIRSRTADGRSVRYQTPRAVEKYIETKNLYRK